MNIQLPLGVSLRDSATFNNFFPGRQGEVMQALQESVCARGEQFIYIWGSAGLGKTHLLQAACHQAAGQGHATAYLPLAQVSELDPGLLEGLEMLSLVCLDDIHAIAGHADWEIGVFNLFNRMRDSGTRLIISASAAPGAVGIELADLASRLGWGLVLQMQPLTDDEKIKALQLRADVRGIDLPDEVAEYLFRRWQRDMPALFELLEHLDYASLSAQRKLTIPFVKEVVEGLR